MRDHDTQSSIPNLSNSWEEVRHKCVTALISRWKDRTVNSYYTINRVLLLCIGLWPYQNYNFRNIIIAFMTVVLVSGVVFQLTVFITMEFDVDLTLHILAYSVPWLAYTLKYNALCLNIKKMRCLMERVRCDWHELNKAQEIEIIKKYSAIGKFMTLITALFIYLSICGFILIYLLSAFLPGIVMTVNKSRLQQFPIMVEYFIDQEKYTIPILLHLLLVIVCGLTTVAATETIHMSYVQHACGLFQIASCRIEQALQKGTIQDALSIAEKNFIIHQGMTSAINIYGRAIEFVILINLIETFFFIIRFLLESSNFPTRLYWFIQMSKANFKWGYILLLPLGVLSLSINLYRLSRLVRTDEYNQMYFSFSFILGHFWYMFFCNYVGQELIDHSRDIFHRTYNVQWYAVPLRSQKLLLLIMQRTMRHCTIIIAGLFTASLEGFATLVNVSISYFTMMFSIL